MSEERPEDPARKWSQFSRAVVAVLGASIFAVLAVVAAVTAVQLGGLARNEQILRATERARSVARLVYVPVSLEDTAKLEQIATAYEETTDLLRLSIVDARGKTLVSREMRQSPGRKWEDEVSQPILPLQPPRGKAGGLEPVGTVTMTLDLSRIQGRVRRCLLWIAAASFLVFLSAFAVALRLIFRMTRRLEVIVGEARLAEELRRSNRELEQFAFVASHDLQEPLRKVVGYCELLERQYRGKLDPEGERIIRTIVGGGLRMRELIKDLLAYARVGTQGRALAPTDSRAVLRETLATLQEPIRESGAKVTYGALPVVLADPGQLGQLFQNLVANAVKFRGPRPPEIVVSAERENGSWRLCVKDNGIGIDPKYYERIFEMFQRLHTREEYPGTGIGLAICKKIVERHGGRIWVESEPGKGTAFYFTLLAGGEK